MAKSLGKGLGSLIPKKTFKLQEKSEDNQPQLILNDEDRIINISPDLIKANPYQPRNLFAEASLKELIESIAQHGIFQPLIVTREGSEFELIAGERRLRAAKELKLKTVPIIIRKANEQKKLELALLENLQREDLSPIENAIAFKRLIDEFNLTQEEVAKKVGKARSSLANTLRLLSLPEIIQNSLLNKKITEAHAKQLLAIKDEDQQINVFKKILRHNLSVKQTDEELIRLTRKEKKPLKINLNDQSKVEDLQTVLGTRVEIKHHGKSGKLIIDFYSDDELRELIKKIKKGN
jgi:ParB family transcriptional regulator, chromosome partitioning protein